MGLARESFTLSLAVSKLRMRSEMLRLVSSGLAHQMPCERTVPLYSPKSWSALASPGLTMKRPVAQKPRRTSATMAVPKGSGMDWRIA